MTLLSPEASPCPRLSYFYRPNRSSRHRTIVFFHGVGIGLLTYIPWLASIPKDVGVLCVEILPISCRVSDPLPPANEIAAGMAAILEKHQLTDVVFVGHSFGTFMAAPLLNRPDIAPRIRQVVLVDPVCLLLHMPHVAYNFTRRKPFYGSEWQIWYVATDPNTANTLGRHFNWRDHILWTEQLEGRLGRRTTVILGGEDCVVCPDAIASYVYFGDLGFTRGDSREWATTRERWSGQGELELMYFPGMDHGQPFLTREGLPIVSKVIMTYAGQDVGTTSQFSEATKLEKEDV